MSAASDGDEMRAPWPVHLPTPHSALVADAWLEAWRVKKVVQEDFQLADAEGRPRARCVPRPARRKDALEDDRRVGSEAQMRDAHGFDRGRDGAGVDNSHVLADAAEGDVRAERLSVERDLAARQLGTDPLPKSEHGRSAGADPEPGDTWLATGRKSAGVVELDVERGDAARCCLDRSRHVSQALVERWSEEGEGDMHQLRFHAT